MNNLIPFNYNSKQVRTVVRAGEPWFIAKDVCEILDITWSGAKTLSQIPEDWQGVVNLTTPGGNQQFYCISESAVYKLAFRSNKEEADKFTNYVASEILPSIRKHGMYAKDELLDNPDLMIEVLQELKREREEKKLLQETVSQKQKELEYKEDVIIGLVDEVELAEKRQILNRVVRHNNANFQERWKELYKQFDMKYHINVKQRMESYNKSHKPKMKSYLDYVDAVMHKVPELYEIACKLYENDIKELTEQIYSIA
jgi:prophage antirepressor-like protein